jgi:GT2 family glycosyltransferase
MLVRRSAYEQIGGFDERFFLYCEDTDICRRIWDSGRQVRFEPEAVATHVGGASGDRSGLRPVLAASRVAYARKHRGRVAARAEALAIGLGEALHALVKVHRPAQRRGHVAALRALTRPAPGAP